MRAGFRAESGLLHIECDAECYLSGCRLPYVIHLVFYRDRLVIDQSRLNYGDPNLFQSSLEA
jgi:hypothetical protein